MTNTSEKSDFSSAIAPLYSNSEKKKKKKKQIE